MTETRQEEERYGKNDKRRRVCDRDMQNERTHKETKHDKKNAERESAKYRDNNSNTRAKTRKSSKQNVTTTTRAINNNVTKIANIQTQ